MFLPSDDLALLAILNSKVVWYFLTSVCVIRSGGYIEVKPQYFEQIPIPEVDPQTQKALGDLARSAIDARQQNPQADIADIEAQIDKLVYQLYALTAEEVAVIEEMGSGSEVSKILPRNN